MNSKNQPSEPNFNTDPDEWRAWRKAQADAYVAAGHKTSFGFWRELHEDLEHGPTHNPEVSRREKPKQKGPQVTTFDPPINIGDLLRPERADSPERPDSSAQKTYVIDERVADLASFGLLDEQAVEPYLKLVVIHLAQSFNAELAGGASTLNKAFTKWAEHFKVEELTRITLEFDTVLTDRSDAESWFADRAYEAKLEPLSYAKSCYEDVKYLF